MKKISKRISIAHTVHYEKKCFVKPKVMDLKLVELILVFMILD